LALSLLAKLFHGSVWGSFALHIPQAEMQTQYNVALHVHGLEPCSNTSEAMTSEAMMGLSYATA
jgi:hypothetical protein